MRHMIVTIPFIKEVKTMRKAMVENLIDLMKLHGVNEVDCSKVNDCPPVIHVGICDEDVTTLNTIELVIDDVYEGILLNGVVNIGQMNIELLVEVYNWINKYKNELFKMQGKKIKGGK